MIEKEDLFLSLLYTLSIEKEQKVKEEGEEHPVIKKEDLFLSLLYIS